MMVGHDENDDICVVWSCWECGEIPTDLGRSSSSSSASSSSWALKCSGRYCSVNARNSIHRDKLWSRSKCRQTATRVARPVDGARPYWRCRWPTADS